MKIIKALTAFHKMWSRLNLKTFAPKLYGTKEDAHNFRVETEIVNGSITHLTDLEN